MSDQDFAAYILSESPFERKKGLDYLYRVCLPKVLAFVKKNSGTEEEAKDIFQDAITILYKHLLDKRFRGESSMSSYTFAIARNLWFMQLRKKKVTISTDDFEIGIVERNDEINIGLIHKLVDQIGEVCKSLLISFYHHAKSMKEIAHMFGLGSEQAAKTKKLRCMKKLSTVVAEYKMRPDDFYL